MSDELSRLASKAIIEITDSLLSHFSSPPDKSYNRAMFRQEAEYGCSLIIAVQIQNGNKNVNITTKFGKVS